MASTSYQEIRDSLRQLYLDDPRPWLVGFSGGKDSTMVTSLVFDAVLSVPPHQRRNPVAGRNDELFITPVAHEDSMKKIGIITDRVVNVGGFSEPQSEFLKFHRTNVFLK